MCEGVWDRPVAQGARILVAGCNQIIQTLGPRRSGLSNTRGMSLLLKTMQEDLGTSQWQRKWLIAWLHQGCVEISMQDGFGISLSHQLEAPYSSRASGDEELQRLQ